MQSLTDNMAVVWSTRITVCLAVLFSLVSLTCGIRCFQCIDSGNEDTDCRNTTLLVNVTNDNYNKRIGENTWQRNNYYKECRENFTFCMIETYKSGDKQLSYHRGCTDGVTFSFQYDKFPRLQNVPPNNFSTCSYDAAFNGHICIRLCNTDMCNGPIPEKMDNKTMIQCRNETDEFGEINLICCASELTSMSVLTVFVGFIGFMKFLL